MVFTIPTPTSSGRETPVSQRRPLQRIAPRNVPVLSPTKRRKQSHLEDYGASPMKLAAGGGRGEQVCNQQKAEGGPSALVLHEVFCRMGVRDIVDHMAPVAKLWRDLAHSKELWEVMSRNVRLVDRLLVTEKVVERRSKGKLYRCRQIGATGDVLLRVVDLELTNAGKDDGIPTSFLREAALLKQIRHPNVIRFWGAEVLGRQAMMCTEYVHESFSTWFRRLELGDRLPDIRAKFSQLLAGLSFVHHEGILHRNLKPDNIFLDVLGTVKIGDFTTTRMIDLPVQAYTPEDPKERDRSAREMRRLWYRAPELILRDEVYGPKVDLWSVGCLLAEAATGKPLLPSDSEMDHLFRTFRLIGTPTTAAWPEILTMKSFSPRFPSYNGFDWAQVARAACCGSSLDQDALVTISRPDRTGELQQLLSAATTLGSGGMFVLSRVLTVPPSTRASADELLQAPFFRALDEPELNAGVAGAMTQPGRRVMQQAAAGEWLRGEAIAPPLLSGAGAARTRHGRPGDAVAQAPAVAASAAHSASSALVTPTLHSAASLLSPDLSWDILEVMREREESDVETRLGSTPSSSASASNSVADERRTALMDFAIGIATQLGLNNYTLHLASCLIDKHLAAQEQPLSLEAAQVAATVCLKIADVFCEQSKEYYKQENTAEYAEACGRNVTATQLLRCEKELLPKFGFDLWQPTVHWFLQAFLAYSRLPAVGRVGRVAIFIGDLCLLDAGLCAYRPSLRAQCALLLAAFLAHWAQAEKSAAASKDRSAKRHRNAAPSEDHMDVDSGSSPRMELPVLEVWDRDVRERACDKNTAIAAAMCLQACVQILVTRRREWKNLNFSAVETLHGATANALAYPERFPVSKLVRYILPAGQRGILPE
eukprot:TRINITY_DN11408_c0_g1_i1.p1 TRINITY_DN11408_c0_g1~~TRINITY_DN11408_c0_g1_i1.p1  ORF type:complete len:881 (+),score=182.93 TRINITY_DN11408_c0_g1_i1:128-2770(+)